jgi:hypothetical protein
MWRWPGDDAVPPLHEEEEAIGSILALEWDNLEREEEEDDAPQRPLGPFPLHAMGQGEENIPPRVVEVGHPVPCGLLEQHTGQKWPRANEASSSQEGQPRRSIN